MPPEYRAMIMAGRPRLIAMAREQYGLELNQGPLGVDSRPALIGAKFAEANGAGEAYHRAVFRAYWEQAADIGDLETLAGIAAGVGLDRPAFLAALDDPAHSAAVDADIEQARAYGLSGVPALVFADRYLVSGAQPYPTLKEVTAQVRGELEEG